MNQISSMKRLGHFVLVLDLLIKDFYPTSPSLKVPRSLNIGCMVVVLLMVYPP